jgi:hypothetical protein
MGMGMVQFEFKKLSGIKGFMNLSNFLGWAYIQVRTPSAVLYFTLLYCFTTLRYFDVLSDLCQQNNEILSEANFRVFYFTLVS